MDRFVVRAPAKREFDRHDDVRTVVELFAGAGVMAKGLEQAGLQHVALVEWDKHSVQTLRKNGFRNVICSDANKVDYTCYRGVDVVAGGPPCQPFSQGGASQGASDERDGWPVAVRAVQEIRPKGFLFENVAGIARERFGEYLDSVLARFYGLGYSVHVHLVDAADHGVPQHRRRVLLTGMQGVSWFQRPPCVAAHTTVREALTGLGPPSGTNGHVSHNATARNYVGHVGSTLDKPSKTLVAGAHGVPGGANCLRIDDKTMRYYTPREMARLQGLPDDYWLPCTYTHVTRLLGNACPALLARKFAHELLYRINVADGVVMDLRAGKRARSPSLAEGTQ